MRKPSEKTQLRYALKDLKSERAEKIRSQQACRMLENHNAQLTKELAEWKKRFDALLKFSSLKEQ